MTLDELTRGQASRVYCLMMFYSVQLNALFWGFFLSCRASRRRLCFQQQYQDSLQVQCSTHCRKLHVEQREVWPSSPPRRVFAISSRRQEWTRIVDARGLPIGGKGMELMNQSGLLDQGACNEVFKDTPTFDCANQSRTTTSTNPQGHPSNPKVNLSVPSISPFIAINSSTSQ